MIVRPFSEQGFFTQTHNLLYDIVMPLASGSEWKVLSFVLRRTKGKQRKNAALSYAEIKAGTGIKSDATIANALHELTRTEADKDGNMSKFGAPILLSKDAEGRGVSRREATRYALNPDFAMSAFWVPSEDGDGVFALQKMKCEEVLSRSSKNEVREKVRSSKIEASRSSKNEVRESDAYKVRAPDEESTKKEVRTYEEEEVRARETASSASTHGFSKDFSSPLMTAVCDVCGLMPDALSDRVRERLDELLSWLRTLDFPDGEALAAAVRERFAHWDKPTPPHLIQVRRDWKRMELIAQNKTALEVNENGTHRTHRNGTSARAQQRGDALAEQFGDLAARRADIERRKRELAEDAQAGSTSLAPR